MKTKKIILSLVLAGACFASQHVLAQRKQVIETIDAFLDQSTPSQISCVNLRTFFSCNMPTLQARNSQAQTNVEFFDSSMANYVQNEYNKDDYAQRLSQDGSHLEQFLRLGANLCLDDEMMYTCIRLLSNKFNWCEIVDYTVVEHMSSSCAHLLGQWLGKTEEQQTSLDIIIKEIDGIILNKFTMHLSDFQAQPDTFITQLAHDVTHHAHSRIHPLKELSNKQEAKNRLRTCVKRMLETIMNKMMWDPATWQSISPSFLSIGNNIVELAEQGVLTHMDDLDDLLGTLNARLCYFLDVYGSVLPTELYTQFLSDLEDQAFFFLEIPETDAYVTPKKELLRRKLISAKTKAIAQEKFGFHTDQLV